MSWKLVLRGEYNKYIYYIYLKNMYCCGEQVLCYCVQLTNTAIFVFYYFTSLVLQSSGGPEPFSVPSPYESAALQCLLPPFQCQLQVHRPLQGCLLCDTRSLYNYSNDVEHNICWFEFWSTWPMAHFTLFISAMGDFLLWWKKDVCCTRLTLSSWAVYVRTKYRNRNYIQSNKRH